jgi:hypothetical protein
MPWRPPLAMQNNSLSLDSRATPAAGGLRTRFERTRLLYSRLTGVRDAAVSREAEIAQKVAQAKGRLELTEEVQGVIEGLQLRAHERSVGVFERLLSAILADVLSGKGLVKLQLGSERGLPALDVQIDKNGSLEDAYEASGGAVTNVLSTGLRFAALSRTANRRLMVLDEADCWLKPKLVPRFIQVIAEVADKARTQTILISHHEPALFEGLVNIVRLVRGEAGPEAHSVEPHVSTWQDEVTPGIRSIRLINFRAHRDTTVPLFPGVTALVGDNDLGKSTAAIGALRAVAYGDSDDTVIRHGETEAQIILVLERGRRIEWVRKLKGTPRVTYSLYENEVLVHEGRPLARGQVPEWITEVLQISKVDELDIQLGSQKEPVFLLNQGPSTRAKLLSVGRESGRLHQLIESYGNLCRKDREQVRDGEADLIRLRYRIKASSVLTTLPGAFDSLAGSIQELEQHATKAAQLGRLLQRVATIEKRQAGLAPMAQVLAGLPPDLPTVVPTASLARIIQTMTLTVKAAAASSSFPEVSAPQLQQLGRLCDIGARLSKLVTRTHAKAIAVATPALPVLRDITSIARTGRDIAARAAAVAQLDGQLRVATEEASAGHRELEAIAASLGGICPLCSGHLPADLGVELMAGAVQ